MQKYRNPWYWTFKGFFHLFVLGFEVLVGVLGVFLFVVFKSRDTVFIQTALILWIKTSILSKIQSFWFLLDFWGGWWGFAVCLLCGFWVFVLWVFSPPVNIKSSWLSGLPQKKLEIRKKKANNLKQFAVWES